MIPAIVLALTIGAAQPAPTDRVAEILISRQLMEQANLHVGDVVTLATDPGGTRAAPFRVIGTYEPTPDPMKFTAKRFEARLHLPDLIALANDPDDPQST